MGQKTTFAGTAYDLKSGKCLITGTGYNVKKGRTLVDGTGYDIKFESGETWYIENVESLPKSAVASFDVTVIYNDEEFPGMKIKWSRFSGCSLDLTKDDGTGYVLQGAALLMFPNAPTGKLLTWLQAYAVKQQ